MSVLSLLLLACGATPTVDPGGALPALSLPDALACHTHMDCVLSCTRDGTCCEDPCDCRTPWSRTALKKVEAHQKQECTTATFECPDAKCESLPAINPRCIEGACTAVPREQ